MVDNDPITAASEEILGQVANEFFERLARGETPRIEEYEQRYPQLAQEIRMTFPALGLVSESLSSSGSSSPELLEADRRLGDFRIVRELGRGGMGIVYEAEQISMGRRVALKVLPFTTLGGEKPLQRFRNEVRAAATLDHPNIVPVYSIGEERGIHYYAMRLVRGQTLTNVIEQFRVLHKKATPLTAASLSQVISNADFTPGYPSADEPTEFHNASSVKLQASTRAEMQASVDTLMTIGTVRCFFSSLAQLGIQAAEALQHAHDNGVLHRDIKPSNLMLDADSKLYVTDFGLARIETDVAMTMTGDVIGTLRYMSPEQALAKRVVIDQRSDIYSLGATLYEMVALQPVFASEDREELLKQIAFDEPVKLRSLDRNVPKELETIIHKSLAKNLNERYATAEELADDLRAFRENRPIKAKPPTPLQRASKWARRHKTFVNTATVAITVAIAISGLLLWRERTRTLAALAQVSEQRQAADENFQLARDTVDSLLTEISENELLDAPAMQPLRRQLLTQALTYYTTVAAKQSNDDSLQVELSKAYWRVGEINHLLGDITKLRQAHERALEIRKQLVRNNPDNTEHQYYLAESYSRLAKHYRAGREEKQLAYGEELAQQAYQIAKRLSNLHEPRTKHLDLLAETLLRLGDFRLFAGDFDAAEPLYTKAAEIREEVVKRDSENSENHWELADAYRVLGNFFRDSGQYDKSFTTYNKAFATYRKVKVEDIGQLGFDRWLVLCNFDLATVQWLLPDQQKEAVTHLEQAIAIARRHKESNPAIVWPRYQLGSALQFLARIHRESERYDQATETLYEALREYIELGQLGSTFRGRRRSLAKTQHSLAEVYREVGQYRNAINSYRRSEEHWKQQVREYPNDLEYVRDRSDNLWRWCKLYREIGPSDDATSVHWECARNLEQLIVKYPEDPSYPSKLRYLYDDLLEVSSHAPQACNRVAWFLVTADNESVRDAGRAVDLARSATGAQEDNAFYWYTLGVALYRSSRWDEAADAFEKAREQDRNKSRGFAGFFFAMNAWQLNRKQDAQRYLKEAVLWMDKQGLEDPELKRFRSEASELLHIQG